MSKDIRGEGFVQNTNRWLKQLVSLPVQDCLQTRQNLLILATIKLAIKLYYQQVKSDFWSLELIQT